MAFLVYCWERHAAVLNLEVGLVLEEQTWGALSERCHFVMRNGRDDRGGEHEARDELREASHFELMMIVYGSEKNGGCVCVIGNEEFLMLVVLVDAWMVVD